LADVFVDLAGNELLRGVCVAIAILGMSEIEVAEAQELLLRVAGDLSHAPVHAEESPAAQIELRHAHAGELEQRPVVRFALLERPAKFAHATGRIRILQQVYPVRSFIRDDKFGVTLAECANDLPGLGWRQALPGSLR